jgi:nickel-dependent lactate racemase
LAKGKRLETREIHLKYGRGEVVFPLPAGQIYFEVVGKDYPAVSDIQGAIRSALGRPIDSPPLRELLRPTDKVAITVSDITRSWQRMDLVLPTLLDTISEAGVPDRNVSILVVVGGHRQNTEEEMALLCGREVVDRVNVVNHNARALEIAYKKCGTTEPKITLMPQGANTLPVILPPHSGEGRSGNG